MSGESAPARSLAVQAFGVTVEVTADPQHIPAVRELLPPGSIPLDAPSEHGRFALVAAADRALVEVVFDGQSLAGPVDLGVALGILDAQLRMYIAVNAPDHVFVHAGVVGVDGRALVLPGKSFAGKTTLVAALIDAGADYWSDEYAALDADGLVHPYAKPLSIRNGYEADKRSVESLGGRAGDRPLPVRLIALTHYRPGGSWAPRSCSAGEGAIKLLEYAIPAQLRPDAALAAVRQAATDAVILEGERGEAAEAAAALITALAG